MFEIVGQTVFSFPSWQKPPSQLGPVTNLSLHNYITTGENIVFCLAMVRVRKVPGLEGLALAAYRQLVVDLAGKVEEAVRGKQKGLGMEQEVG